MLTDAELRLGDEYGTCQDFAVRMGLGAELCARAIARDNRYRIQAGLLRSVDVSELEQGADSRVARVA